MMKAVLALFSASLVAACGPLPPAQFTPVSAPAAPNDGAAQLFAELDRTAGPAENAFFSPVSVEQAFGMLHLGAAGETRSQLEAFLGWPTGEEADRDLQRRREGLLAHGTDADIRLANALWLSDRFRFRAAYLDGTRELYDATAETLDFDKDAAGAARRINSWAAERTNGLIEEIVSKEALADNTAALDNAYFRDEPANLDQLRVRSRRFTAHARVSWRARTASYRQRAAGARRSAASTCASAFLLPLRLLKERCAAGRPAPFGASSFASARLRSAPAKHRLAPRPLPSPVRAPQVAGACAS